MAHVLHAYCYITKSMLIDDLDRVIRYINEFWLRNIEPTTPTAS
jgi:hypothetical protein